MEMGSLFDNSKELDRLRKEQEDVHGEIDKIHKKLQSNPEVVTEKLGDNLLSKLRSLYVQAKELSENEANVSNALMSQLDALLQSGLSAAQRKKIEVNEQKKKRMKADSEIPRFSPAGSMRSQLEQAASLKGEQVAARVTHDDAEKDEWFVVKVMHFDREAKVFEVLDEEPGDDEESTQKKYKLPMTRIIPFPKRGILLAHKISHLADLFWQSILELQHCIRRRWSITVSYLLEFDDDEEDGSLPQRTVPFYRVVGLPEGHRQ